MQLDLREVQEAVADYLHKRGVIVGDTERIQIEIIDRSGARMNIVSCTPVVVAYDVELPAPGGPYRDAAAGALKP